jgi:hypothetical protein
MLLRSNSVSKMGLPTAAATAAQAKAASASSLKKIEINERRRKRVRCLLSQAANSRCCDCNDLKPTWATIILPPSGVPQDSLVVGAFCCLHCSAAHRKLGNHICHIRSVNLDDWSEEDVQAMQRGGNLRLNAIFEGSLMFTNTIKPTPLVDASVRQSFIRDKYETLKFFVATGYNCIGTEDEDEDDDINDDDDDDNHTSIISVLPENLQNQRSAPTVASTTDNSAASRPSLLPRQASMPTIRSPSCSLRYDDLNTVSYSKSCSTDMDFWESMSNSGWGDLTFELSLHQRSTMNIKTKINADSWNLSPNQPPDGKGETTLEQIDKRASVSSEKRKCGKKGIDRHKSERLLRPSSSSSSSARSSSVKVRKRGKKDQFTFQDQLIPVDHDERRQAVHGPGESTKHNKLSSSGNSNEKDMVPEVKNVLSKLEQENVIRLAKARDEFLQPSGSKPIPRRHRSDHVISKTLNRREMVDRRSRSSSKGDRTSFDRRYKKDLVGGDKMICSTSTSRSGEASSHVVISPALVQRKSRSSSTTTSSTRRHKSGPSPSNRKLATNRTSITPSHGGDRIGPSDSTSKLDRTTTSTTTSTRTKRSPYLPKKPASLNSLEGSPRKKHGVPPAQSSLEACHSRSSSCDTVRSKKSQSVFSRNDSDESDLPSTGGPPNTIEQCQKRVVSPRRIPQLNRNRAGVERLS